MSTVPIALFIFSPVFHIAPITLFSLLFFLIEYVASCKISFGLFFISFSAV